MERDKLIDVLREAIIDGLDDHSWYEVFGLDVAGGIQMAGCIQIDGEIDLGVVADKLSAAWREARTITEQTPLAAMPYETVIRDKTGRVFENLEDTADVPPVWAMTGSEDSWAYPLKLPARVLYLPGEDEA